MTSAISSLPGSSVSTAASLAVARTTDAALPAQAVGLSADAGVIATLGGASSSLQTYDAAGLLNTLVGAGQPVADALNIEAGSDVGAVAQDLTDSGVTALLSSDAASSGIYSASGGLQSLVGGSASNWSTVLKTNPELAGVVVGDSFAQGVIGGINTTA